MNGIRSLFPLVGLKGIFMFKSNGLVNPKSLRTVFSCCRQDQKGTGGTEVYIFNVVK